MLILQENLPLQRPGKTDEFSNPTRNLITRRLPSGLLETGFQSGATTEKALHFAAIPYL